MPSFTENEVQDDFDRLVDMAIAGQEVLIMRDGQVVATIVASAEPAAQHDEAGSR